MLFRSIFHFGLKNLPDWKLYVGIILTGLGAALVLYSKEETEKAGKGGPKTVAAVRTSSSEIR